MHAAPLLFNQAGLVGLLPFALPATSPLTRIPQDPSTSSFIASGCTGIILTIGTVVGSFYIDKVGRRKIWIWGGICIALSQLVRSFSSPSLARLTVFLSGPRSLLCNKSDRE